ncbi:MAG: hypothetical protein AAF675_16830, partial [Pseudomonadota bacterium]
LCCARRSEMSRPSAICSQWSEIAAAALALGEGGCGADAVSTWASAKAEDAARADKLMAEFRSGAGLTVAKLAVAASQFRTVVAGGGAS